MGYSVHRAWSCAPVHTLAPDPQPGQPFLPIFSHSQSPFSTPSGLPKTSPQSPLPSPLTHHDKHHLFLSIWNLHILHSSGAQSQGQTSAPEPQQHTWSLQLGYRNKGLLPFVPQLDEVCCSIPSSGSWSLLGVRNINPQTREVYVRLWQDLSLQTSLGSAGR